MTSAISNFATNAYNALPSVRLSTPSEILQKTQAIALPAIALVAASQLEVADGGGIMNFAFAGCILSCLGLAEAPPLMAVCMAACGSLLAV